MAVTPVAEWLVEGEEILLPTCNKTVKVRPVDLLGLLSDNGNMPNFLLKKLFETPAKGKTGAQDITFNTDEMLKLSPVLDRLTKAVLIEPAIVTDLDAVRRGEGILVSFIPLMDKMLLFGYAMGGKDALTNAERFPEQQIPGMDAVQPD